MGEVTTLKTGNLHAPRTLADRFSMDPERLEFIRKTIAMDAPDLELEFYLSFCQAKGLDPTAREVYYIRRFGSSQDAQGNWVKKPQWTIQIAIDGFRSLAEDTGEYDGQDDPVFDYDEHGRLVSATVRVYRKTFSRPIGATAFFSEYVQTDRDGIPNSMWKKSPRNQLAKCAEALALRKAFPRKLGGIYTNEEMGQADNPEVRNVTPTDTNATRAESVLDRLKETAATIAPEPDAALDPADQQLKEIVERLRGMTPIQRSEWANTLAEERGLSSGEMGALIERITGKDKLIVRDLPVVISALMQIPVAELVDTDDEPEA